MFDFNIKTQYIVFKSKKNGIKGANKKNEEIFNKNPLFFSIKKDKTLKKPFYNIDKNLILFF